MALDTGHFVIEQHCKNRFIYTLSQCEISILFNKHLSLMCAIWHNVCNLTVLNHDSIIDFKSVTYFPEYAKVLSDQCYHNSNNNLPGSSKSNKVKWANIVQLKFME